MLTVINTIVFTIRMTAIKLMKAGGLVIGYPYTLIWPLDTLIRTLYKTETLLKETTDQHKIKLIDVTPVLTSKVMSAPTGTSPNCACVGKYEGVALHVP